MRVEVVDSQKLFVVERPSTLQQHWRICAVLYVQIRRCLVYSKQCFVYYLHTLVEKIRMTSIKK